MAAKSANLYWKGAAAPAYWATVGCWSTDLYGSSGAAAAPVATDVAIFNIDGLTAAQPVLLNANQLALGLISNSTGTVTLTGSGANRTLTLGANGITKTGTGALTIGSATTDVGVGIVLAGNQTWSNNAAGEMLVYNAITGAFNLDYASTSGTGVFRVVGLTVAATSASSTYSGITTIKSGATVIAQGNAAFGSNAAGTVIESGGMLNLFGPTVATPVVNTLNLGTEAFTVSGTGVGGIGAIVNTSTLDQQNAIQGVVTMVGDTTFGGSKRWDIRNATGTLNGGGFTLTKLGTNTVGITGGAKIGTALNQVIVREGEFLMESGAVNSPTTMTNRVLVQPTTAVTSIFRSWGNYADHTGGFLLDSTFVGSTAKLMVDNAFTTHSGTITTAGADTRMEVTGNWVMTVNGVVASSAATDVLRKEGTGILLLNNAANTYDGVFNLNAGTLGGIGTLASGALNVNNGAALAPGLVNSAGTFNVTNAVISGGTNTAIFNLGTASDLINVGTLTQNGTTNVVVTPGIGYGPGTYKLYDYTTLDGTNGFGGFSLAANHIDATLVNNVGAGSIDLQVNSASVPTWSGVSNGIWQAGSMTNPILPNFTFAPAPGGQVEFVNNDAVLFDDSATGTTSIAINGTVTPAVTRFNNAAKPYTINGVIPGTGSIIKDGSGIATLLSTPTTIGGLDINAGTLQLGNDSASVSYTVGNIDIAAGATLAVMAGNGGAAPVLGTAPSLAGTAGGTMISGGGTILLNSTVQDIYHNFMADRASVTISGDMTGFTGNIIINDTNRLAVNTVNSLGNAAGITINNGGTLYSSATLLNYAGPITASGIGWEEATGCLGAIRLQGGTLSGPITLAGDTRISAFSGAGTISGVISGSGKKLEFGLRTMGNGGSGTLTLSNPANVFGDTSLLRININAATIANTGVPSSLGSGAIITMESGSLVLTGDTANPTTPQTTNRSIILNQLGQGGGNLGVATPGLEVTYTGAITNGNANFPISTLNFSQTTTPGTGGTVVLNTATPIRVSGTTVHRTNLTLAGNTQYTVDWATTGTTAAPIGTPGALNLGNNQSATDTGPVTLTIKDTATLTTYGDFDIGNANSGAMQTTTVNQTGGTVNALRGGLTMGNGTTKYVDNRAMRIGHWPNNTGIYNLSGGTLNAPNGWVQVGFDGTGIFNQSGGTANLTGLRLANSAATGVGTYNLTGGVLNIGVLGMARVLGSATFNFDGGTYRATANHPISSNIVINVQAGGGTLDTNGYNVNSASALLAGTVPGGILTKTGAGEFNVPAGISTMDGTLNVNDGSLGGTGTYSAATVHVNNGGTLAGTLSVTSVGGVVVASGGTVSPGANGGAANGTLTASAAALSAGSTIQVSGNGDVFAVTGALSGTTTISVVPTGTLPGGPITLVTYGTNTLGFSPSLPHLTGATLLDNGFGAINLNYTTQELLTWTGSGGAVWDYGTANTWNASGTGSTLFLKGDLVEFGESAVANVAVQAGGVTPANVSFTAETTAYTLTGGGIGGGGSLTKTGAATVVLANDNSYVGTTTINGGTLQIGNGGSTGTLGLGATTVAGGATLSFNRTGTSTVVGAISGGGSVRSDGPGTTILAAANAGYTGATVISKGTLTGYMANSFGTGAITLNDVATGISNTGLTFEAVTSDDVITIANPVTVANQGSGTVTLGSSERSLRAIGTIFTGAITLGRDVTMLGEWDRTTFSGVISGTANTITIARSPGLDAGNNGRVTWEGENTFTAATVGTVPTIQILEGASFEVGQAPVAGVQKNQIPDNATVNVQAGGTFQLATAGDSETIGNLTGAGTVRNRVNTALSLTFGTADNTTFSGVINGGNAMSYLKQGTGTAIWSGNLDNPTGNIRVVAGTMVFAKESTPFVHAVGGDSFIQPGATLQLAGSFTDNRPKDDGRTAANTTPLNFTANYVDQIYNNANLTVTGTLDMNGKSEALNGLIGTSATAKVTNSVAGTTSILYVGRNNATASYIGILEDGAGKLNLEKTGTGTQTLGGVNTYTGTTTIYGGGAITINTPTALGSAVGGTVLQCSRDAQYATLTITLAASTPEAPNIVAEPFTMYSETESDQRTQINNTVESTRLTGGITLYGDGINQIVASQTAASLDQVQLNGPITGPSNGTLFLRGVGEMQVNGVINAPNLQVAKTDTGTLILNSTGNNYGEATFVHGTVRTTVANALDPTALLRMGQTGNANTLDLNGFNQTVAGVRINSGVTDAFARTITSNSAPADLTIDTPTADGGDYNYTGIIAGQLSLIKSGPGSQVLGGSNTYSGITTVNNGSLYMNGTHSGGGDYTVANGAILGGEGTITTNGNVTYANGSALRVGNTTDAGGGDDLVFNLSGASAFTLNSSTTLSLDLWANLHLAGQLAGADQTQSDVLAVTAPTINLAGILNVANPANISSWAVGDTFDLFDWFTTPTGTFASVNLPDLGAGLAWDTSKLFESEATDPDLAGTIRVKTGGDATPIQSWRLANFGTSANSGNAADNADPDKDGVPNLVEYGLGMNPNVSSKTGLPTYAIPAGSGVISFGRNLAATDVTYVVQASNDLATWATLATRTSGSGTWAPVAGGVVLTDLGTGAVSVTDNVTVTAQPTRFMRVLVTNPLP